MESTTGQSDSNREPNRVAVLIATCNRSALLAQRSLTSIQRQTRRPDYLVVVDDSDPNVRSDNRNVVNDLRLGTCQIIYLANTRTRGASGAWNTGLDWLRRHAGSAEALLVAVLDDDDEWEPGHLELCYSIAQSAPCDMVAAGILRITDKETPRDQQPPAELDPALFLVGNPHIQGSNLFVRLSALLEAGTFDEALRSCTDRDLCLRLADLGWIRYRPAPAITVRHYADTARPRLSAPAEGPKRAGLDRFWAKWHGRMTDDQRERCMKRAHELFGWEPRPPRTNAKEPAGPLVPAAQTKETRKPASEDLSLVVGIIADAEHADQCRHLLEDLLVLQRTEWICSLDVVLFENGPGKKVTELASSFRAKGVTVFVASRAQQVRDADGGLFGPGFERANGRAPIGPARTMLQSYVSRVAKHRPRPACWILDDDSRLDNLADGVEAPRFESFLASLKSIQGIDVDVVLGNVTGDPPVPPGSTVRTQLVDLAHNLQWLWRLNASQPLPDRREENREGRRATHDYYYDLSRRETHHLEWPFWLTPTSDEETAGAAYRRMVEALPRVLAGQELFRPLVVDEATNPISSLRPSVQRGTNTFAFDTGVFEEFPNLAPRFAGSVLRRSDMIWALLNRYAGARRIVGSALPVRHDRSDEPPVGMDLHRLVPDIRGYALYSALEDVLVRRRERRLRDGLGAEVKDDLRFRRPDLDLAEARFKKYLNERTAALLINCWRIQGLCGQLANMVAEATPESHPLLREDTCKELASKLLQFLKATEEKFAVASVSKVVEDVIKVPGSEVREFMRSIGSDVRRHRRATPPPSPDPWFEEERTVAARAVAEVVTRGRPCALLGAGQEGVVFASDDRVVKVFDCIRTSASKGGWKGMELHVTHAGRHEGLYECTIAPAPGGRIAITYPREDGKPYRGGDGAGVVRLLASCKARGIVTKNLRPKNLLQTDRGVRLIDYGVDIVPLTTARFHSMAHRAWLSMRLAESTHLPNLCKRALDDPSMPELEGWQALLAAAEPPKKEAVVDTVLLELIGDRLYQSVLDFGCGRGELAHALAKRGQQVMAYDPDAALADHWKNRSHAAIDWRSGDAAIALEDHRGRSDLAVCSLVLCAIPDDSEYLRAIRHIADSLAASGRFVFAVCNPDATFAGHSSMQARTIPCDATPEQSFTWEKLLPNGRTRPDTHRPLRRILADLDDAGLGVTSVTSAGGIALNAMEAGHDYLFLVGSKGAPRTNAPGPQRRPHLGHARHPIDIPVLCYHRVLPACDPGSPDELQRRRGTVVDRDVFELQVGDLCRLFEPVSIERYCRWLSGQETLPKNACLVTFDDAYRDFRDHALPVLSAANVPCVLFATLAAAEGSYRLPVDCLYAALSDAHRSGRLDEAALADWLLGERKRAYVRGTREEQHQMLAEAGLLVPSATKNPYLTTSELTLLSSAQVALGGHGVRHELLADRSLEWQREELLRSRLWLERLNQGRPPVPLTFAYPNGSSDEHSVAAAIECGYEAAFGVTPHAPGRYAHRWSLRRSCVPNRPTAIQELANGHEVKL